MQLVLVIMVALITLVVIVVYCIVAVVSYIAAERRALLYALSIAAAKNVPLQEVASAIGKETLGPSSWKAHQLSQLLTNGIPFPEALRVSHRSLPNEIRVAARCGWEMGCLGDALAKGLAAQDTAESVTRQTMLKAVYVALVLIVVNAIVGYMMVFVVPVFSEIFEEFDIQLPMATVVVIAISYNISRYWYLFMPFVLLLLAGTFLLVLYAFGLVPSNLLLGGYFTFSKDRAVVLRGLALGAESGWPIRKTLELVHATVSTWKIRARVQMALHDMDRGVSWLESFARHGLINARERGVLQAAERVGNPTWAMQEIAQAIVRRRLQRVRVLYNTLLPCVILLLGCVIGFILVGVFLPLVTLIAELA